MIVRIVRCTFLKPRSMFIQWAVKDPPAPGVYSVKVFRSGSLEGPWEELFTATNTFAYVDTFAHAGSIKPNYLRLTGNLYYRVTVVAPTGATATASVEAGVEAAGKLGGIRRKAERDLMVQLRKLDGSAIAILKRKHYGELCLKCRDKTTHSVIRSSCKTCWGTGITGGYWNPVASFARRTPAGASSAVTPQQRSDTAGVTLWLPSTPAVEPDDILVSFRDQRRYVVSDAEQPEVQMEPTHQKVTVQEISSDSLLYEMQVSPDVRPLY